MRQTPQCANGPGESLSIHTGRRAPPLTEQSRGFFLLGVLVSVSTLAVLLTMFIGNPVTSEEDELIGFVTATMKKSEREWIAPEVLNEQTSLTTVEQGLSLALYRMRLVVLMDLQDARTAERAKVFMASLLRTNLTERPFPLDLDFRLLTGANGSGRTALGPVLQQVSGCAWIYGRLSASEQVLPLPSHAGKHSELLSPAALWLPLSDWELAAFLDLTQGNRALELAPLWFTWLTEALRAYGTLRPGGFHRLPVVVNDDAPTGGDAGWYSPQQVSRITNPSPASLVGFALDVPYMQRSDRTDGTVMSVRAAAAADFFTQAREQRVRGPVIGVPCAGLAVNVFFANPWRRLCGEWEREAAAATASVAEEGTSATQMNGRLPWHTTRFQRWMTTGARVMAFPLLDDGTCLVSDRTSVPLSKATEATSIILFPAFNALGRFDPMLERVS